MHRKLASLCLIVGFMLFLVPAAQGGTVVGNNTITGTVNGSSPCYNWLGFYHYDATTFIAPSSGDFTFVNLSDPRGFVFMTLIYGNSFDPYQILGLQGIIGAGPDSITAGLQAGATYTLLIDNNLSYGTMDACRAGTDTLSVNYVVGLSPSLAAAPGCDALLSFTSDAAGGTLITDTPAYWRPGEATNITLPAGKSFWVLGIDSAHEYYQIYLSCQKLWVPASSIGPNYDAVWTGRPLPTTVIDSSGSTGAR